MINSSVLGLVFEKLNGYKEGSFYTPSFITSYMTKESLHKIVLDKFQKEFEIKRDTLESLGQIVLKNQNSDESFKDKAIKLLDSIKICDPAVGSGHFLVSALNEMIFIHYKLNLFDSSIDDLYIENDEIIIHTNGAYFKYERPKNLKSQNHQIQVELFNLKKRIIENNLFGVDINPNSVEICKLRLWIELLKNSYYLDTDLPYHDMQTLPNIDINIKCGNSLISYFDINQSLSHYPNIKNHIDLYKKAVSNYKEGFGDKKQIKRKIKDIKETFRNFCFRDKYKNEITKLENKCEKYSKDFSNFGVENLPNSYVFLAHHIHIQDSVFIFDIDEKEAQKELESLIKEHDEIFDLEKQNPFEWRFEFPEVLDENGDFLGFDLIIGNPPYVVVKSKDYKQYKWNNDLYTMFFEIAFLLTKQNGYVNFITPRFWLVNENSENMRKYFLENINLISLTETNPFEVANTENIISYFKKSNNISKEILHFKEINEIFNFVGSIKKELFYSNLKCEIIFDIDKNLINFFNKIQDKSIALKDISKSKRGAEYGKKFIKDFLVGIKILVGGDVKPYELNWQQTYIDPTLKEIVRLQDFFDEKNLILLRRVDSRLTCTISNENFAFTKNLYGILITDKKYNPKLICGLLNSKFLNFYYLRKFTTKKLDIFPEIQSYLFENLPIPKIDSKNKKIADKIIALVDKILESKAKDSQSDTKKLESKIDDLVYKLYNLSDDETKIIEG